MGNEASTPNDGEGGGNSSYHPGDIQGNVIIPNDGMIALPKSQQSSSQILSRQKEGGGPLSSISPGTKKSRDDDDDDENNNGGDNDNNDIIQPLRIQTCGSYDTGSSMDEPPLDQRSRQQRSDRQNSLPKSTAHHFRNQSFDVGTLRGSLIAGEDNERKIHHFRNQSFDGGSLRGSLIAGEDNERKICRDPLLEAVAAGAAVRKARQQQQQQRIRQSITTAQTRSGHTDSYGDGDNRLQQEQQQQHQRKRQVIDNEWRTSLRRLATVAASTAKTVAHVTAPVLSEAKVVVVSRATDFAQDVQEEWKKKEKIVPPSGGRNDDDESRDNMMIAFVNDEETVALYTPDSSPLTTPQTPWSSTSKRSRSGSGSFGSGDKLFASYLLPTLNSHFQSQRKLQEQQQQEQQQEQEQQQQQQQQEQEQRQSIMSGLFDPSPPSSSTATDFTNDYSAKWRESVSFSSVLPVNVEEETEDGGEGDENQDTEDTATNNNNNLIEDPKTTITTSLSSPSSSSGSFLKQKTIRVDEDPTTTTTAAATTTISIMPAQSDQIISSTPIEVDTRKQQQMNVPEHSIIVNDTAIAVKSMEAVQPEENLIENIIQPEENILEGGEIGQTSISSLMSCALEKNDEEVDMDQTMQLRTEANEDEEKEAEVADVAVIAAGQSIHVVQPEENLVQNGRGGQTSSSGRSWLPNPFHSASVVDAKVNSTAVLPFGGDGNASLNNEETTNTPFVESLAIYESPPEVLINATQAVRNYHANVQTLAQCETDEQKEMCRIVCDDTYRMACQLVAGHSESIDDIEVGEFQTRLLDDLRRLREVQKTAYTVENKGNLSSGTGPAAARLHGSFRSDESEHQTLANRELEEGSRNIDLSIDSSDDDEIPTRLVQTPDEGMEERDKTVAIVDCDADFPDDEVNEPDAALKAMTSSEQIQTPDAYLVDGRSSPSVEALNNCEIDCNLLNSFVAKNCVGRNLMDDGTSIGLQREVKSNGAEETSLGTSNLHISRAVFHQEKSVKAGPLFAGSANSIYVTEETAASTSSGHKESKGGTAVVKTLEPIREASKLALEENPLSDGKTIIKFLVTKLTGYDVEIKNKGPEISLVDPDRYKHTPVPESVFRQWQDAKSMSSSSLSSPPEVDLLDQNLSESESSLEDDAMPGAYIHFDYIPGRHEISTPFVNEHEEFIDLKTEKSSKCRPHRGFVKQLSSNESIYESAGSMGTFPKSLDSGGSVSRSARRASRRSWKDGKGRKPVKSPVLTPNGRSPNATPVDDRSLVNGSNLDLNLADPGGNFVRWDNETEANFPSVPDTEEMTEVLERSNLLDEALMTFSSLEDVQFLKGACDTGGTKAARSLAFLIWRQLVANWKHFELWKAMTSRPCSLPSLEFLDESKGNYLEDDSSSMSTVAFRIPGSKAAIRNTLVGVGEYCTLRSPIGSGAAPSKQDFVVLARFLCDIGPRVRGNNNGKTGSSSTVSTTLQHELSSLNLKQDAAVSEDKGQTITLIQDEARKELGTLRNVVDYVVRFAAQNDISCADFEVSDINASLNVKDYSAIRRKAARKYDGDVLQVKDVLRAQITFPSEGSLVCGLYGLHAFAGVQSTNKTQSIVSLPPFEIVRMKNLFQTTKVGTASYAALPTGYRHILINIRFGGGLLAEIQFQLGQLFGVMGSEGYSLHQELISARENGIHNGEVDYAVGRILSRAFLEQSSGLFGYNSLHGYESSTGIGGGKALSFTPGTDGNPKKVEEQIESAQNNPLEPHSNSFGASGIAGAAAAAAAARSKKKDFQKDPTQNARFSPVGEGGIASLAAAAAKSFKKDHETNHKSNHASKSTGSGIVSEPAAAMSGTTGFQREDVPKASPNPFAGSSVAAAAAAAAINRQKKIPNHISSGPNGGDIRGIAAAAAAAAKSLNKQDPDEMRPSGPIGGGIAAAAAAAAAAKNRNKQNPDEMRPSSPSAGGIAAAAASAAKSLNRQDPDEMMPRVPNVGGIAAAAAAAAAAKNRKEDRDEMTFASPMGGGIAAAAAAAAMKKNAASGMSFVAQAPIPPENGSISEGIADAAWNQQEALQIIDKRPLQVGSGGIAAAAAAAAAAKNRTAQDAPQSFRLPSQGGRSAASDDNPKDINHSERPHIPCSDQNGLSSVSKILNNITDPCQSETVCEQNRSLGNKPPNASVSGGIAAAAAAAASKVSAATTASNIKSEGEANESETNRTNLGSSPPPNTAGDKSISSCFTLTELMAETVRAGISEAIAYPRDLPAFFCLHLIVSRLRDEETRSSVGDSKSANIGSIAASSKSERSVFSRKLLLRSLAISNQATSIGMVGWLEYGSSNPLERTLNLPFEVLQQLACSMASNHDWIRAADVLSSLVMRCEQSLPLCHPTTLSAMLDLAGALTQSGNMSFASTIVNRVLAMLTAFLSDLESLFFAASFAEVSFERDPNTIILMDGGLDVIAMMQAFASAFHAELSRDFLDLLGPNHSMWLLNHSLVADTFSVLANCLTAGRNGAENCSNKVEATTARTRDGNDECGSFYYWTMAYTHFQVAFKGWTKLEPLSHANAACAAYSLARCLRELGRVDDALKILELVASCLERKLDEEEATKAQIDQTDAKFAEATHRPVASICFLPTRRNTLSSQRSKMRQIQVSQREQTAVLCFWMMAVMTVEQSPDERGRNRALSLLHTASLTLQRSLGTDLDAQTRRVFLDLYQRVEDEAMELFEPLQRIQLPELGDTTDDGMEHREDFVTKGKKVSWVVMTPMREKRVWISPRKNRAKLANPGDGGNDLNPVAL